MEGMISRLRANAGGGIVPGPFRVASAALLAAFSLPAHAHLCDNVFRQADKLIVKPETYNLVVKDKTTFKIFLQNNMDRGIADISLIAESPAFDFTIKPQRMAIQKDQRTYFEVTMSPKASVKTGNYSINFRLVGGDDKRLFKIFSLNMSESEAPESAQAPKPGAPPKRGKPAEVKPTGPPAAAKPPPPDNRPPAPARDNPPEMTLFATGRPTTNRPDVDGTLADPAWKRSAVFSGFSSASGGQAVYDTTALLTFDREMLYLGVLCSDEDASLLGESDFVEIILARKIPNSPAYSIKVTPGNTARFSILHPDRQGGRWIPSGLCYAVSKAGRAWSLELAIPFAAVGAQYPRAAEKWLLRINRNKASGNAEQTYWSADERGANSPKGLGVIELEP